jgi:two-component system cell cycle sensor histidine kinase/response regulator CckA
VNPRKPDRPKDSAGPDRQELRRRAEEIARDKAAGMSDDLDTLSPEAVRQVFHELRVHQIQLEMQNEELRRAQEALDASRARYFDLFDLAPVGFLTLGDQERILEANLTAATLLGTTRGALVDQRLPHSILPDDREDFFRFRQQLLDSGTPQQSELRFVKKDGTFFWARLDMTVVPDDESGAPVCRVTVSDISTLKQAEEKLRKSEARYRSFFEEDLTADFISTVDGRLLECNPAFARIFGFETVEQAMKTSLTALYFDPGKRNDLLEILRSEKQVEGRESCLRRQDGTPIHIIENVVGLFDETGTLTGLKGYLFDITEHKNLEERLRQSGKMEAIGQLAGGVAHDFNNLLTAIQGYTEMMLAERSGEEDQDTHRLQEIQKAALRAVTLTRQLLTFSRREVVQPRLVELNEVIRDFEGMLQRLIGEDIELRTRLAEELPSVYIDPGHLEQVILNLVVNAREAMSLGGRITIETEQVQVDETMAQDYPDFDPGEYVVLAISDTGKGMDAETQAHLFEPFFTTKKQGTGLGLATVFGIVQQAGGHISVYSQPKQGTTMKIRLPAMTGRATKEVPKAQAEAPRGDETVLVVEDEPAVRELMARMLELQGYRVLAAATGEEALRLVAAHHDEIRLLVTDVIMPTMSGREVARRASRQLPGLKVLYTSGYTDGAIEQHGILKEGMAFLQKPFTVNDLAHKVREVLDG